jgi:hypothetical protein
MTDDDEEVPTRRDSGSLPLFIRSVNESLEQLLNGPVSAERDSLIEEARSLLARLDAWSTTTPLPEERTITISRVLDLYRNMSEWLTRI